MRQEYLNSIKAGAIEGWYKYKITPSLTAAQAALESGWGTSKLAAPPYNNNFGIKAGADWTGRTASMTTQEWNGSKFVTVVDTFRAYDSINDSVEDHGAFFTSTEWRINNYRNVVGEGDYKKACHAVANAGYATDPNYASKLINIIETYNLQSWDVEAQNGNPNNATMENTKASKIVGGAISSAASQSVSSLLLSVIGDSLGVGTEKFLKKYPWAKAFYDNLGSRQWTHATASLDATKILQTMLNNGNLQRNVVFILGTNRGVTAGEIDNVVSMCGRDRNIILVDTASEVNHRNVVSNAYREASKRHENVFYANWSDYARANIATWYHADGANGTRIHMKDSGYQKHAEFIIQAVYEAANTNWVEEVSTPTEKNTERINIYDIEYDDGKYTSPKGDSSIYNKELNDQLGFRPKKAQIMWIERKYTGEEDNAADLLEAALKKMDEYSVPAAQYTVPMRYFPPDVSIGDTGYFIDHEFNPPLYIYARVLSMTTSVTNPGNDSVVIGNVIEVHPKDKADILALQKELQENREEARLEYWKVPPIVLQMISSNGLNFKTKPGELYGELVHSTVKNPEVKNGFVDIPVHKAKKLGARISITGSIKDNYIDIVDEITNEINAPVAEEVFTGPVDPNSNPQGNTVKDITAPLDVRQLIVKQLDVRLLDSDGLNMGTTTLSVYEDSTFALKTEGLPKHINKIRILSNQNLVLDDISALDMSDPVSGAADKTRLYVKAFQEDTEVTHKFKNFSWSRISSNKRLDEEWNDANKFNETNGIDLTPSDVFGNESTFVCKMFDENGKFIAATSSSVTITKEGNKNTVSDSTMPPRDPSPGDKWTAIDGDSEEEYYYVDGEWVQTGVSKKVDEAIQEAEQAKADAIKAYNDAIAEAERLVIEQDEVWQGKMDDYDEQVAQIEADVQSAQDKATQALTDVGISTDLAQTAKDLATTAQTNASTAISNASKAQADASTAVSDASKAKEDASQAVTDALTAITQAGEAVASANTAKTNAQTALDNSNTAITNAEDAITKAGEAVASANTAKTNAQTAIDDAKSALTTAGNAKTTAESLSVKVDDLEGEVELKASQTEVDGISGTVSTHTTALSQQATAIASKADKTVVDTLSGTVSNQGTLISQNATDIASKASSELVNTIKGTVDTHTTEIAQNATDIASKASSTSVNALTGRVSTAETAITQNAEAIESKASQTEVDDISGTVSSHTTTLSQHAKNISSKAESSLVNTIKGTVDTHTTEIAQNATDIASKASTSSVNTLTGRVDTAESNISQNATAITQRVTTTTYNAGIASKENAVLKQSTAPTHVNGRLWLDTSVTPNILKRSNGTTWIKATPTTPGEVGAYSQSDGAGLAGRLTTAETNISQTATAITSKADKSTVDTLAGTVSTQGTTLTQQADLIESKANQSEVDTVKGTVSDHTSTLSQHATQIASKASSASVNTLTGRVSTAETTLTQQAGLITSKASQNEVDTIKGTVSSHTSTLSQHASQISARLTTSQVNSLVDGKGYATQTWANNQISATANGINAELTKINQTSLANLIENGSLTENTVGWGKFNRVVFGTHDSFGVNVESGVAGDRIFYTNSKFTFTPGMTYDISFYIHRRVNSSYVTVGQAGSSNNIRVAVGTESNSDPWKSITYKADASNSFSIFFEDNEAYRIGHIFVSLSRGATKDWTQAKISIETDAISQSLTEVKGITDNMLPPNLVLRSNEQVNTMVDLDGLYGSRVGHSALRNAIRVSHGETYTFSQSIADVNSPRDNYMRWAWVDANLNVLSRVASDNTGVVVSAPVGARYLRFSYNASNRVKVEKGSVPTAWVPHQQDSTDIVRFTELQQDLDGFKLTAQNTYETKTKVSELELKADRLIGQVGADGEKIAQMVMTDSLFSTKVLDVAVTNDTNLLVRKNERERNIINSVGDYNLESGPSYVNHAGLMNAIRVDGLSQVSFSQIIADDTDDNYFRYAFLNSGATTLLLREADRRSKFTVDVPSGALFLRVSYNKNNRPKVQAGGTVTPYAPAPEDAVNQSEVTQLADSWALTLKSGNDIKTQINASTSSLRLSSKFIHLNGSSLIDNATIKSAHIDTLNANKIVGNTADFNAIRTGVLTANAVTSTHIKADTALFDTLFSTESATRRLSAIDAWIKNANIISINADKITAGTISAARISTSSLANLQIGGRNLFIVSSAKRGYVDMDGSIKSSTSDSLANESETTYPIIQVKSGETYYFTKTATGSASRDTWRIALFSRTGSGLVQRITNGSNSFSVTIPSGVTTMRASIAQGARPKIEKGTKPTDWTPAPEDIINDLGISGRVEIHGGNIKADTLDVGAITGDKASFLQTSWQGLNSSVTVDSSKIRLTNSAKDYIELNGIPEVRSQDSAGTSAIMGKGRSHYYSGSQARFYIGSNLEGLAQYGVHIAKGQTWGIYRNSDTYGGTPAQYHVVVSGESWRSITNKYWSSSTSVNVLMQLNGYNVNNYPVLQPGDTVLIKPAVPGNSSGVERIWTMGTSSNGSTRVYSHVHHVFEGGTTGTSDRRLKHDIEPTQVEALGHIESLTFKEFKWNRDNSYEPLGLIAQDSGIIRVPDDEMEGINIQRAIMLALKGTQELNKLVKEQAEEIRQLKEIINQ